MVAWAKLAIQRAKKLFQKDNLENKHIFTLSGADIQAQSIGIDP